MVRILFTLLFLIAHIGVVHAQVDTSDSEIRDFDVELKKINNTIPQAEIEEPEEEEKAEAADISAKQFQFSDLGKLAPFKDISVIQKRFMPKTDRFEIFGGGGVVTNDPFFITTGLMLKGAYFFSETWGMELNYFSLATSEKQSTEELRGIQGVRTESLVYPKSYYGVDLTYVPMYGKYSLFNKSIVPFDLYFSLGYGNTRVNSGLDVGTIHAATGQIFSLSKKFALRWDFSWNFYSSRGIDGQTSQVNNLFLTVGMSMFFPEADYR